MHFTNLTFQAAKRIKFLCNDSLLLSKCLQMERAKEGPNKGYNLNIYTSSYLNYL